MITRVLLDDVLASKGIEVTHVDVTDLDAVHVRASARTPRSSSSSRLSNPHMDIADVPALATIAREHGLTFVVDNTFLSPAVLRPLEHGADLVVHSATKWLGGHGDAVAGAVAGRKDHIDRVRYYLDALGGAVSPFNSWLIMRGMRTLSLRMRQHSANAQAVAEALEAHEAVERVWYPGLVSHPHHDVARRLLPHGFGGMLALRLRGGGAGDAALRRGVGALGDRRQPRRRPQPRLPDAQARQPDPPLGRVRGRGRPRGRPHGRPRSMPSTSKAISPPTRYLSGEVVTRQQ